MIALLWLTLTGCGGLEGARPLYTGTIEVTEVEVASVMPGRLVEVRPHTGDRVNAGDLVFTLDAASLEVERDLRVAGVAMAEAAVSSARAQTRAAAAQVAWLDREAERTKQMEASGVGSPQQSSTLQGQLDVARAKAAAAREAIAQAEAAKGQAEAGLKVVEQRLADTQVHASQAGVVLSRNREPGEVVGPGASVITLGDLDHPRLRVYVPLKVMETLEIGSPVSVRIDANPEPFEGRVEKIASEAEFTPRDILTPEERVKRVFAVDVALPAAPGLLPGVPAEAEFTP